MKRILLLAAAFAGGMSLANAQTARLQAIHNSADAAATTVDVYVNGALFLDDFAFRTATPFTDVTAGVPLSIAIAPGNSTSVADAIATFPVTLTSGETYVVVANGIVSATGYSPAPTFNLDIYGMGREAATQSGNTDILVMHGSTDAPVVDVVVPGAGTVVNDIAYGEFDGYLELATADYTLNITDASGATVVASYQAPLQTLILQGEALVVVASGFLDPTQNSNGEAFGLWAALPTGGALVELPNVTSVNETATEELGVYPNPAVDEINLTWSGSTGNLSIYDVNGRLVKTQFLQSEKISVSDLNNGIYQFVVESENDLLMQRVVIRK